MSSAPRILASFFTRSGRHPRGVAVVRYPSGDVTPPCPAKYGTLAARYTYSSRHVWTSSGIQSSVVEASHESNLVPADMSNPVRGVPGVAAPVGARTRYRPGLCITPPPNVHPILSLKNHMR